MTEKIEEDAEEPERAEDRFRAKGEEDGKGGGRGKPCGEENTRKALIFTLFLLLRRKN